MAQHNQLGEQGEKIALEYLKKKGLQILDHNWKWNGYEVDIIARNKTEIIFVEVKTRSSDYFGNPEDFVDNNRQRRLTNAANAYVKYYRHDLEPRFDIVAIIINNTISINHIEYAFNAVSSYY